MSAITTRTCRPRSKARCSATVSASRGVVIRSTSGSSAVLRNSDEVVGRGPRASSRSRIAAASAFVTPIAAKTTANGSSRDGRLRGDLRGELEVREAPDREDRELLPAHERRQPVDDRDAGQDRIAGRRPRGRVDRVGRRSRAGRRRAPAGRRRAAPRGRCRPARATPRRPGSRIGLPCERDASAVEREAARALEDLDDRELPVDLEHDAVADLARVEPDLDHLVPADVAHALDDEQRPLDRGRPTRTRSARG